LCVCVCACVCTHLFPARCQYMSITPVWFVCTCIFVFCVCVYMCLPVWQCAHHYYCSLNNTLLLHAHYFAHYYLGRVHIITTPVHLQQNPHMSILFPTTLHFFMIQESRCPPPTSLPPSPQTKFPTCLIFSLSISFCISYCSPFHSLSFPLLFALPHTGSLLLIFPFVHVHVRTHTVWHVYTYFLCAHRKLHAYNCTCI